MAEGLDSPETAAIDWLTENGYDVGELGPEVLRPYLLEGLNLIAFKLQKGTDTGAIRPVMLTYTGAPFDPDPPDRGRRQRRHGRARVDALRMRAACRPTTRRSS